SSQLRTADVGDRLFVCGTQNDELYLLGVLKVTDVRPEPDRHAREAFGDYRAKCTNVCAPFRIIPLGGVKWNLRFLSETSDRPSLYVRMARQVATHRVLTPQSAKLLIQEFREDKKRRLAVKRFLAQEGKQVLKLVSARERDPRVRKQALAAYGHRCMVCDFD